MLFLKEALTFFKIYYNIHIYFAEYTNKETGKPEKYHAFSQFLNRELKYYNRKLSIKDFSIIVERSAKIIDKNKANWTKNDSIRNKMLTSGLKLMFSSKEYDSDLQTSYWFSEKSGETLSLISCGTKKGGEMDGTAQRIHQDAFLQTESLNDIQFFFNTL